MAITVKYIQDKEFTEIAPNAYDAMQVDDFLDELVEQIKPLLEENQALTAKLAAAEAEKAEMEKKLPDYNESGYFKQLESAMRDSLIGAQRIADETVSNANKKAQQTIEDADAKAEKTVSDAQANADAITAAAEKAVAEMKAEQERLQAVVTAYRDNFKKLLDDQLAALKAGEALLK